MSVSILDKASVQAMDEAPFRAKVLVPLLKAMGYGGVYEWHGGSGELGKDVVGWKIEPTRHVRTSVAIVAKAKVPSPNPAVQDIAAQVAQALNTPFNEPTTGELIDVNECWVMVNKPLKKETRERIRATIQKEYQTRTQIYDLNQVWELVEQHLPVTKVKIFDQAQGQLQELNTKYRVSMSLTDQGRRLEVGEKYPGQAEQEPLRGRIGFQFPDTPEGHAKREEVEAAFETGAEVIIPPEYLRDFIIPEEMQQLAEQVFGVQAGGSTTLRISSAEDPHPRLISIEMTAHDGDRAVLPYVDLRVKQAGSKQMILTNEDQPIPILITMVIHPETMRFTVNITTKDGPVNAQWLLTTLTLVDCLHKRSHIKTTLVDSGMVLADKSDVLADDTESPVDPEFRAMIADLAAVEAKVNLPIYVPEREFTDDEMDTIETLRKMLQSGGEVSGKWKDLSVTATCTTDESEELIAQFVQESPFALRSEGEAHSELFGTRLPLGQYQTTVPTARLVNEEEVRAEFASAADGEEVTVRLKFEPGDDRTLTTRYVDWMDDAKVDSASASTETQKSSSVAAATDP